MYIFGGFYLVTWYSIQFNSIVFFSLMLIYNKHTTINIKHCEIYINPFYIELQETIVGKYLNIIHTYIHI